MGGVAITIFFHIFFIGMINCHSWTAISIVEVILSVAILMAVSGR